MDSKSKKTNSIVPVKYTQENSNPNVSSPSSKSTVSPSVKPSKTQKSGSRIQNAAVCSPRNKIKQRKFVVAKKKNSNDNDNVENCKCKSGNGKKCLCVAYESLRVSQDEFFKNRELVNDKEEEVKLEIDNGSIVKKIESLDENVSEGMSSGEIDQLRKLGIGVSTTKRRRNKLLESARTSMPECGKVMNLVNAFESMLTIKKSKNFEMKEKEEKLDEENSTVVETRFPNSLICPTDLHLTSVNLGLVSQLSVASDGSQGSSCGRESSGGQRSRRNSSGSCGTTGGRMCKKKHVKVKPFRLRTEQRGRLKEEEFTKKVEEMKYEEEKLRIPIAQGLPWTTDEPESLIKPQAKENTRPIDMKLHTDIRAMERNEFDTQVAEKWSLVEQYKTEMERLEKLAEEEEVRRLRKELVPKALPMPYFDQPFIPRRSMKYPTIPREPKFHISQHDKIK